MPRNWRRPARGESNRPDIPRTATTIHADSFAPGRPPPHHLACPQPTACEMTIPDQSNTEPNLEPMTQQFIDAMSGALPFHTLPADEARAAFERLQSAPIGKPTATITDLTLPIGPTGSVAVRVVRPPAAQDALPVVIYCHGGGWIHGDAQTYDRLIREIAVGAGVAVVFVGHDRSPQAQYPTAIEQTYAVLLHLTTHAQTLNVDATRVAIAGDGTGGTVAAAVTLLVRERRGPKLDLQVLICPITNADFATLSYQRFADGPWLTRAAMQRGWDAYLPDTARRAEPHAAPLCASLDLLAQLPEALVIVAENDVARDDGENYARRLSDAGVRVTSVRYNGTIHDFVVLNALADTPAARGAIEQIIGALKSALG
jgi:acetyl esterase